MSISVLDCIFEMYVCACVQSILSTVNRVSQCVSISVLIASLNACLHLSSMSTVNRVRKISVCVFLF